MVMRGAGMVMGGAGMVMGGERMVMGGAGMVMGGERMVVLRIQTQHIFSLNHSQTNSTDSLKLETDAETNL